MRSTSSIIPTSARRAISSAAPCSARLRGRASPRAKPARPVRFNWLCGCPSEMELRMRARVVLALAALLCTSTPSAEAQFASTRSVLTIHAGAENFPSNPILDAGIRDRLLADPEVPTDYFTEYLESDLFPGDEASLAFKDYLRRKYQDRTIDVVIAMTDTSLRFILDHRSELFPDVPIVFFGLAGPDETTRNAGGGITGVRTGVAYAETLKLALTLHPSTQRVFVVAVASDEQTFESARAEFSAFSRQVRITYLTEPTVSRLVSTVRTIPQGSVILYVWQS